MSNTTYTLATSPSRENLPIIPPLLLDHLEMLLSRGERVLLGIVGAPGAGKSTLSNALMTLPGVNAAVLPMDGFHLANRSLERLERRERKGAPDTFDVDGYVALLGRVRAAWHRHTLYAPEFDRDLDEGIAGAIGIGPDVQLVITEGNYLLLDQYGFGQVAPLLDECWYVDIDDDARRQRLQARHQQFGMSEKAAQEWVWQTDEPNAQLVKATLPKAQQVITL